MLGRRLHPRERQLHQVLVHTVCEVELSRAPCEPHALEPGLGTEAQAVVQRRPAERGRGGKQRQPTIQPFAADQRTIAAVLTSERTLNLQTGGQERDQLAAEELRVGGDCSQHEQIHHALQVALPLLHIPPHPPIPRRKTEDRIRQTQETHQLAVVLVVDHKAQPPPVSRRDRDTPVQPGIPEEQLVLRVRPYQHEPRVNPCWRHLLASSDVGEQPVLVALQASARLLDAVFHCALVQGTQELLRVRIRRYQASVPGAEPLHAESADHTRPQRSEPPREARFHGSPAAARPAVHIPR